MDLIDHSRGFEHGFGHLLYRGHPQGHSWCGAPLQVDPKQVHAGRVGATGGKRLFARVHVEGVLCATICLTPRDCQRQLRLDATKYIIVVNDIPRIGKPLNVGQIGIVLFPGMEFNMCRNGNPRHWDWHHCTHGLCFGHRLCFGCFLLFRGHDVLLAQGAATLSWRWAQQL